VSLLCTCPFSLCGVLFSGNPRRLLPHCRVRSWTHCLRPRSSSEIRDRQRWSRRSITSFVARQRTSHLWERRKSFQFVSHFTCRSCALAHSHSVVFCFQETLAYCSQSHNSQVFVERPFHFAKPICRQHVDSFHGKCGSTFANQCHH
jgi:hypothetical protein